MSSDTVDQVAKVKARLRPELNAPYFEMVPSYMALATKRCDHRECGVRLDETDRACYCKGCGKQLDPFESLWNYAHAEQRLVNTLDEIKKRQQDEVDKKAREKARRPFLRAVVGRTARKDMSLKAEPIVGYDLKLECGHVAQSGGDRRLHNVTCHECAAAARKKTQ